jgi:hypothetical protein
MRLTTLDLISTVMDLPDRPLDFAVVLHLEHAMTAAALERGAAGARQMFPRTGAILDGTAWRVTPAVAAIQHAHVAHGQAHDIATAFINLPFDLSRSHPVRQLLISYTDASGAALVTRMHHAVADGVAALIWLRHQLEVALGRRTRRYTMAEGERPALRQHPKPARKSAFAYRRPADRLADSGRAPSAQRGWRTLVVPTAPIEGAAQAAGVTCNDLLATSVLEMARRWNAARSPQASEPAVGLWMPINIRNEPMVGMGNGSSRIRVYNRYDRSAPARDKCRSIREQVDWSRTHGEWAVPSRNPFGGLPMVIARPAMRAYFQRPWADMGTLAFSHLQRSPLDDLSSDIVTRVEMVGVLARRHPLGIYAASMSGATSLSFVHDPIQIDDKDLTALIALFREQLDATVAECAR